MIKHMLIDLVVLAGVAVVLPLALGGWRRWAVAATAVAVALVLPVGPLAAMWSAVWLVLALHCLASASGAVEWRRWWAVDVWVPVAARGFAVVAAGALTASRAGLALLGIGEPIVQLTAVHFVYAGVGAVTLAGCAAGAHHRWGRIAAWLTVLAPPVVATGFVVRHPVPQVGGAVLMSVGVLCTAGLQLREALAGGARRPALLAMSGLAPWIPMVLAVAWAASLYWAVPALSIPDMARTHGVMNVVFVIAGLVARRTPAAQLAGTVERAAVVR